jgi:hypothetical protein
VDRDSILIIEIYVDDIIFGNDDDRMSQKFAKDIQNDFEMSFLDGLTLFLGLQICPHDKGIVISHSNYIIEMINKFGMEYCKHVSTSMYNNLKLRKMINLRM